MRKLHLFTVGCLLITGCSQTPDEVPSATMEVSDFADIGEIHNSFLDNVVNNGDKLDYDNQETLDKQIIELNKSHLRSLNDPRFTGMEEKFSELAPLLSPDEVADRAFYREGMINGKVDPVGENVFQGLDFLNQSGTIKSFSYNLLTKLSKDIMYNYEGTLDNGTLKANLLGYIQEYNSHGYSNDSGEGEMVGTILAISIASLEWWEQYPEIMEIPEGSEGMAVMVGPWLATDIGGAIVGGIAGALVSKAFAGEVDWRVVGVGALITAVDASTGFTGKVGYWIGRRLIPKYH